MKSKTFAPMLGAVLALVAALAGAQPAGVPATPDATIRKVLAERFTDLPKIDEITKAPMPGLYEVRVGTDLFYTDAEGSYLIIGGQLLETKTRRNVTEERQKKLTAIDFASLPLKPAEEKHKGLRQLDPGATPPLWKEPVAP